MTIVEKCPLKHVSSTNTLLNNSHFERFKTFTNVKNLKLHFVWKVAFINIFSSFRRLTVGLVCVVFYPSFRSLVNKLMSAHKNKVGRIETRNPKQTTRDAQNGSLKRKISFHGKKSTKDIFKFIQA